MMSNAEALDCGTGLIFSRTDESGSHSRDTHITISAPVLQRTPSEFACQIAARRDSLGHQTAENSP